MTLDEVVSRFQGVRKTATGYKALCPAHDDSNTSLSISEADGGKIYAGATLQMLPDNRELRITGNNFERRKNDERCFL